MSLIEMLVAMVVTLIMMGGVVALFGTVGDSVSGSRAVIEISERLRYARNRLQEDLSGVTVTMLPPRKPEAGEGYFEYIEGEDNDLEGMFDGSGNPLATTVEGYGLLGDTDDLLMFTARSRGEPFVGRVDGGTVTSPEAEIVWFTRDNGQKLLTEAGEEIQIHTLYRRILLVAPTQGPKNIAAVLYQAENDLSVHNVPLNSPTGCMPNTLGDLTKRENRFNRLPTFPFEATVPAALSDNRLGEDVILNNVLAFDVRAWDPNAEVRFTPGSDGISVTPSDAAYRTIARANPTASGVRGAYVDLFFNRRLPPTPLDRFATSYLDPDNTNDPNNVDSYGAYYSKHPNIKSGITSNPTYCTWSWHYEADGIDQFNDGVLDTGVNGMDDNLNGIVDDPSEFDTSPPYPVPLRGIQVKIRVYEPDSRQVREVTLVQDFLPQ